MNILISLLVIFSISFLLILKLVYSGNKEESTDEKLKLPLVIVVSFLLALAPTAAIGLILFVLLGSAMTVNLVFSLNISLHQLIILAISYLAYLFTVDSVVEMVVKHILRKNIMYYIVILLLRVGVFFVIGDLIDLTQIVNITVSIGIALMILFIELSYHLRERHMGKEMDN